MIVYRGANDDSSLLILATSRRPRALAGYLREPALAGKIQLGLQLGQMADPVV